VELLMTTSLRHESLMAETNNNTMRSSSHWKSIYNFAHKMKRFPGILWRTIWKVGKDDPRRIIHSLKVGLALALVSLLYLMEPLFKGIGNNAMWAVMTVVVVMEFTAGMLYSFLSDIITIYIVICLNHSFIEIEESNMIAGGTLSKGLNRGLGTLLAGSLAFFIRYLADVPGQIFHAIFIGATVFLLGKHIVDSWFNSKY
jgi:uncharacterized membrane protein YccC